MAFSVIVKLRDGSFPGLVSTLVSSIYPQPAAGAEIAREIINPT